MTVKSAAVGLVATVLAGAASAQTLIIGSRTDPLSIDPHLSNSPPDLMIGMHFFDHLIFFDQLQQISPGLATAWKPLDDTTWEFKLRQGVKFHDGTPFTADDVVYTFAREGKVEGATSSPLRFIKSGDKTIQKIDDHTVHVKTKGTYVLTPQDLAIFAIVSKKHGEGARLADWNAGKAIVGTGPFKFVEWVQKDRLVMDANPDYWGGKMQWQRVTFKPITSDPTRVAALLAGDVDLIDNVPTSDLVTLKRNANVAVHEAPSNRVIYWEVDSARDITPNILTLDGKPMFPNPLRDWRVRKAISMAINRDAIVERVMEGAAIKASQMLPEGFFGISPNLQVEKFDLEGAKKLLAEAGYGKGFQMVLHGPNDRYVNDAKIVEACAQMLERLGIKVTVQTMPRSIYFTRTRTLDFTFQLKGYGSDTGEVGSSLLNVLHTYNAEARAGSSNNGRYSNPRFDLVLQKALVTLDDKAREKLMQEASEIAINDLAVIPLHYQKNLWASKRGLQYQGRTDEFTLARFVTRGN